jgi:hypothetical protein
MSCECLAAGLAAAALGGVPLVGVWSTTISGAPSPQFDGSWKLGFSSGGGYVISKGAQKLVTGKAAFRGATVTFRDLGGPASCIGTQAVGSYRWSLTQRTVQFAPVKDACAGRRYVLSRRYTMLPPAS